MSHHRLPNPSVSRLPEVPPSSFPRIPLLRLASTVACAWVLMGSAVAAPSTLLRFHGSNTIGDKLMPALVRAYLTQELHCSNVHEAHPGPAVKDEHSLEATCREGVVRVEIFSHGTETGFEDLGSREADVAMASDRINQQQLTALRRLGDLTSPEGEHILGLDGIAVIVHPSNRISSLSLSQLADLFSGRVTDWKDVGGTPGPVHIFARDENSGTWAFFRKSVLKPRNLTLSGAAKRIEQSEELSGKVQQDTRAIGFIGLNYIGNNRVLSLSTQGVRARQPLPCTVKTEEYLLTRRLYLYTSTRPSPAVRQFIRYATSARAWPVVHDIGLVSNDPTPDPAGEQSCVSSEHSAEWLAMTRGHSRVLTNFGFNVGSTTLDNKGLQELDYVAAILATPKYQGHRVLLIGYADQFGSYVANMAISVARANAVNSLLGAKLLAMRASVIISMVVGMGAQDFVAPNDTPENREKNRRVEIWVDQREPVKAGADPAQ